MDAQYNVMFNWWQITNGWLNANETRDAASPPLHLTTENSVLTCVRGLQSIGIFTKSKEPATTHKSPSAHSVAITVTQAAVSDYGRP